MVGRVRTGARPRCPSVSFVYSRAGMIRRSLDVLLPAALVLLCIATLFVVILPTTLVDEGPASLLSNYDFVSYFAPRYELGTAEMALGHLPLWNRYEYGGLPLLAMAQPAALYPPKVVLFSALAPTAAHWAFLLFHYLLGAFTFFQLMRERSLRGAGLFVGTAGWIFATYVLVSNYHPVRLATLAWTPLLFTFGGRVASGGGRRPFALLALFVALQILAGYPEATADIGLLLSVHVTVRWLQDRTRLAPWRAVPLLAAAFALGAVTAGLQLLPLAELASASHRAALADRTVHETSGWVGSIPPLAPMAPALIIFFVVGFALRAARPDAICGATCIGIFLGGWRWLRLLPGFSMIRLPFTWLALAPLFLASTAALGADLVAGSEGTAAGARRLGLLAVAVGSVSMLATWVLAARAASTGQIGFLPALFEENVGNTFSLSLGLLGAGALATLALRALLNAPPRQWAWLVALTTGSLAHIAAVPFGNARAPFEPPSGRGEIAELHGHPREIHGRVLSLFDVSNGFEIRDRLPSPLGAEDSFLPWRWQRVRERIGFAAPIGLIDWDAFLATHGFWNAMNVGLVAASTTDAPLFVSHGMHALASRGDQTLFSNPGRLGYAWVNHSVRAVASEQEAFDYVMNGGFDPRREVVLEEAPRGRYATAADPPITVPSSALRFSSTEVELEVDLRRPGVLVVSESAFPGWKALVDGTEHRWLTANYVLRGVELGPGHHRVRFEYRPASVLWGALLSCVGLAGIAALVATGRRRQYDDMLQFP